MAATIQIEVWVIIDEDGDYAIAKEQDDAVTAFESDIAGIGDRSTRRIKLTLNVPLPKPITVCVDVPEEPEGAVIRVD